MKKILFINSCVRKESRTLELARCLLDRLDGDIREINLEREKLKPIDGQRLEKRDRLLAQKDFSDQMFRYAKEFAAADTIVIAAPYWDLSFPALLKTYFEQITVCGITFRYQKGIPQGLCRAKKLIYITTAGGTIYDNFGFDYIKALAQKLYGIDEVLFFKAENLDIDGSDTNGILQAAKREMEIIWG
ncbi:MAG: NAD(P)H-dependent oxidoreductase [Eubacteriales bacterium]